MDPKFSGETFHGQISKQDQSLKSVAGDAAIKQSLPWSLKASSKKMSPQWPMRLFERIKGFKPWRHDPSGPLHKAYLTNSPKGPFVEQGKRNLTKLQSDPSIEGQNLQMEWEIDILYSEGWDQPRVLKRTLDTSGLTSILHEPSCHIWGLWCASYISYVEEHASEATGIVNTFQSAIPTEYHTTDDSGLEECKTQNGFNAVLAAIGRCQTLNDLSIVGELNLQELLQLCKSLSTSHVVTLELTQPQLGDEGAAILCEMMTRNHSIKRLGFHEISVIASTSASFGSMLSKNSTLESLDLGLYCEMSPSEAEALLRPLTGIEGQPPLNTSLKHLKMQGYGDNGAKAVGAMLATNITLTHLVLFPIFNAGPSDVCIILQSLKTNKTLQVLEIYWGIYYSKVENPSKKGYHKWGHQDLEEVFVVTMDLLQDNPWLEDVNLFRLNNVHKMAIKAQLNTNAFIRSRITSQHNVSEKEVSQKLLEIQTCDGVEVGVDKLKECTISTMGNSSIHVHQKDDEIMPQTNVASTSGLLSSSPDAMVTSFHQTLNFITKYLKISCLDKVYHQVNGGIHEDVHAKQLLESHGQHNPGGIIVTSRIQAHEQRIQFLFGNTHAMTKVVGVGLDYAQVYWTQNNEILVEAIEENEWSQLWQEAFTIGSSFHEPILMYMPSDVNDVESLDGQTIEEICWEDVFGTIPSCGEVFLLELITTFFMTRKVIEDYEIPMTIQDSSSTRPNAIDNIGWEGKFDCDSIQKFTIGGTQHPNNLLGLLWNIFSNGGTHVGGAFDCIVGNEDDGQGALSQNGGIDGGGDNNTYGDGGANASNGRIDTCDNNFQGGARVVNVGSDNTHEGGRRVNASSGGVDVGGDNVTHDGGKTNGDGDKNAQGDGKVDVGGDNVTHGGGGANGGCDNDAQGGGKVDAGGDNNTHGNGRANGGGGVDGGSHNNAHGDGEINGIGDNNANGDEGAFGGGDDGHNGKSGNGGGSGGGGGSEGRGNENNGHLMQEPQKKIVKVQPGSKGYWCCNGKTKVRIVEPKGLKDAHITPNISFGFFIDVDGIKTLQTELSVNFDMKHAEPNEVETKRFGWFQRRLKISLECSEDDAAKLQDDEVLDGELQKRTWKANVQKNSGTTQFRVNGNMKGGLPFIQGGGGVNISRTMGTNSSLSEEAIETLNKQIDGGFTSRRRCSQGKNDCLFYEFNYLKYPKTIDDVDSEDKRESYINTGLCSSVKPKVMGTWDSLDESKISYMYTFEAQRTVCELKRTWFPILKNKSIRNEVEQIYKVEIHVNHQMTHICRFKPRRALKEGESDTLGELLEVGLIDSPPLSPLTLPASSSVSHHSSS
ncbi:unnamed protein product [Sphagnum troendelagicum]